MFSTGTFGDFGSESDPQGLSPEGEEFVDEFVRILSENGEDTPTIKAQK